MRSALSLFACCPYYPQHIRMGCQRMVIELEQYEPSIVGRLDLTVHALRVNLGNRSSKLPEDRRETLVNRKPTIEQAHTPIQIYMRRSTGDGPSAVLVEFAPAPRDKSFQASKIGGAGGTVETTLILPIKPDHPMILEEPGEARITAHRPQSSLP
jgi:hypothetical protein